MRKRVPVSNEPAVETTNVVQETVENTTNRTLSAFISKEVSPEKSPEAAQKKAVLTADIKGAIYNICHPSIRNNGENDRITTTYGNDFKEICNTLSISPTASITKAALTKLTRNDAKEDANSDFYGALNRAFSYKKPDEEITYKDLQLFFMRGSKFDGELNFNDYCDAVEEYSNIVQSQYEACTTDQEKLEFIIAKTKDYLTESCMKLQLAALKRLTTDPVAKDNVPHPDKQYEGAVDQVANVGQIAFADLGGDKNGIITCGAYMAWNSPYATVNQTDVGFWVGDEDKVEHNDKDGKDYWRDCGITLNTQVYCERGVKWYDVVEVLVHELTHATAYYYYGHNEEDCWTTDWGIDLLDNLGLIKKDNYEGGDVLYMLNTMWGEWAAYTTTCNYYDSIGGDLFDNDLIDNPLYKNKLAVHGVTAEEDAIRSHLKTCGYDDNKPITKEDGTEVMEYRQEAQPGYNNWDWDEFNNMFYFDLHDFELQA